MADISKIKPNGADGTEYDVKDATARSAIANKANNTQTFTEASTRTNIASGENMATLFGKIKKFFSDLKTVAFTGAYSDLSGQPTIPAAVAVKGNAESAYRTGNVNITPANIGLGNVNNTADANKSVNYATSAGSAGNAGKVLVEGENSGAYISVQAEGTTVIDSEHDSHYYFPSCKAVTSYLNSNFVKKINGLWDFYYSGSQSNVLCSLPSGKTLADYSEIWFYIMGGSNVIRLNGMIPRILFTSYHNAGQQLNFFINNKRVYVQITWNNDTSFYFTSVLDGTYCDRVGIYLR